MVNQHFKCWMWKILWSFGGLALVLGWFSLDGGSASGLDTTTWYWTALIFATLSISIKLDCHNCNTCQVGGSQ